jgi:hypothetical protein
MERGDKAARESEGHLRPKEVNVPETPSSAEWRLRSRASEQQEIILELEETILNLEKGYNSEIMDLRRNIAELDAEILSLRRHLYMVDPNAVDLAELVRDTCFQASKPPYFRPSLRSPMVRERGYFPETPSSHNLQNLSYYTEGPRRTYRGYFEEGQLNLGERMMGRPCGTPLALKATQDFKFSTDWRLPQM